MRDLQKIVNRLALCGHRRYYKKSENRICRYQEEVVNRHMTPQKSFCHLTGPDRETSHHPPAFAGDRPELSCFLSGEMVCFFPFKPFYKGLTPNVWGAQLWRFYSLNLGFISRSEGRSAVSFSAYISGSKAPR